MWTGLLAVLALLLGCSAQPPQSPQPPTATTSSATGCLSQAPAPPADAKRVTVSRVVDGDTIDLSDGAKARLVGMNTPESVDPRRPVQPYGKEASAHVKGLLEGKEVWVLPGRTPQDKYGRLLAWVWLPDGRLVNALLVQEGYAQKYTFSDNPDHADLIQACEQEARKANRGLWALPTYHNGGRAADMNRDGEEPTAAAVDLKITAEPGSVARGDRATLAAATAPGASCTITVEYKSGASSADGLEPHKADAKGAVRWSWAVGAKTATGTWPIKVNCGGSAVYTEITVK